MLIYSVVKGFVGEFAHIQRNAIRSWRRAFPDATIVLFGQNEHGARQEADRFGLSIYQVERNEHGAPLLPSLIEAAHKLAQGTRCLINADIILEPAFARAVDTVSTAFPEFLLITCRINSVVDHEIDFDDPGWLEQIKALPHRKANRSAIDVFCYTGDWLADAPPFGIGRCAWDNWIVNEAKKAGVPVVDASRFTQAWHQDHAKQRYLGQIEKNRAMLGKWHANWGSLDSAGFELTNAGDVKPRQKGKRSE